MKKSQEIKNPMSCLNKAGDDEPLFILRAQDSSSAETILEWIRINFNTAPDAKLLEAFTTALEMKAWNNKKPAD